jgi:hypothetical protein
MKFKLELTEQEINLVLSGLSELPAKFSIELLNKIQIICKEQYDKQVEENN